MNVCCCVYTEQVGTHAAEILPQLCPLWFLHCTSVHFSPLLLFAWPFLLLALIVTVAHFHSTTPSQLVTSQAHPYSIPQPAAQMVCWCTNAAGVGREQTRANAPSHQVRCAALASQTNQGSNKVTLGVDHTPKTPTSTQNSKCRSDVSAPRILLCTSVLLGH